MTYLHSQKTLRLAGILLAAGSMTAIAGAQTVTGYVPDLVPAGPTTGHCYARVQHHAQYANTAQNVTLADGYSAIEITDAQIVPSRKAIIVRDESIRYEVRQPTYRTVRETVMTRPAYEKLSVSRPQFRTITETLTTGAPRRYWKRGNPGALAAQGFNVLSTANGGYGSGGQSGGANSGAAHYNAQTRNQAAMDSQGCGETCEIWCMVEEPAASASYQRKVMTRPAEVTRSAVPAQYSHYSKEVLADAGGVTQINVPAQYRTIVTQEIIPGHERHVNVPPVMGRVNSKTLVSPDRYEWMRVYCDRPNVQFHGTPTYPPARR